MENALLIVLSWLIGFGGFAALAWLLTTIGNGVVQSLIYTRDNPLD